MPLSKELLDLLGQERRFFDLLQSPEGHIALAQQANALLKINTELDAPQRAEEQTVIPDFPIRSPEEQRYDFAWEQLCRLQTTRRWNEYYIDLSHAYAGTSFGNDPDLIITDESALGSSIEKLKDNNHLPAYQFKCLKEAQRKPGKKDAQEVAAPPAKNNGVASAPDIFNLITKHPDYPYYRMDMDMLERHGSVIGRWIDGKILYEPCGGQADKILQLLKHAKSTGTPSRVIVNDTEELNVQHLLEGVSQYFETEASAVTSESPPVIGIRGDWMNAATYQSKVQTAEGTSKKRWAYLKDDVLKALGDDPAGVVLFLPGATANDFAQPEFLKFLHDNFPPGTLFIVMFDNETDKAILTPRYSGHALVQQLTLTGITHTCWENIKNDRDGFKRHLSMLKNKLSNLEDRLKRIRNNPEVMKNLREEIRNNPGEIEDILGEQRLSSKAIEDLFKDLQQSPKEIEEASKNMRNLIAALKKRSKTINTKHSFFDPRLIGVDVEEIPSALDTTNVQISVYTKDQPERKLKITPIIKKGKYRHNGDLKAAKLEVVERLWPSPDMPANYAAVAFCHQGYAEKFREALKA